MPLIDFNINPYAAGEWFSQDYRNMKKTTWEMIETLAYGYTSESTQRELSNKYQRDQIEMVFKSFYPCAL